MIPSGNRRQRQFVGGVALWMVSITVGSVAIGVFSLRSFFILSLIGLLIVSELTAPLVVALPWRRRVRVLLVVGLLVFGALLVHRVLSLFPSGVL